VLVPDVRDRLHDPVHQATGVFFFQAAGGIRYRNVTGVQTCALPILEVNHIQELFDAGNTPNIWSYMPIKVQSIEDMRYLVNGALQAREQGTEFPFVIFDKDSGEIVGSTRFLNISIPNSNLEIGWTWLSPKVWRTSINTECKYLLLKHCFEMLGAIRVQLKTDSRNVRSQQAIERIGA